MIAATIPFLFLIKKLTYVSPERFTICATNKCFNKRSAILISAFKSVFLSRRKKGNYNKQTFVDRMITL